MARIDETVRALRPSQDHLVGWSLAASTRVSSPSARRKKSAADQPRSPFAGAAVDQRVAGLRTASGRKVSEHDLLTEQLAEAPPVPTTSIFSRSAHLRPGRPASTRRDRKPRTSKSTAAISDWDITLAVYAVADRLAQPEGEWKEIRSARLVALSYPDWRRG